MPTMSLGGVFIGWENDEMVNNRKLMKRNCPLLNPPPEDRELLINIIYLIKKKFHVFLLGWPLHILIDVPTHSSKIFPTPFLFPISNYTFNGISWGNPIFMLINYSALFIVYLFLFRKK